MDKNKIKNIIIIILSLMTIYFCFRSIYLDNKLKSGTDIKHETSVPDTVYKNLDEFKKVDPYSTLKIPTGVTLFKDKDPLDNGRYVDDTLATDDTAYQVLLMTNPPANGYSRGSLRDSMYQFLLSRDKLSLTFKNTLDSSYKIEDYYIDLDKYDYNWVDGKLTFKEVKSNIKLTPYINGKYRMFNRFLDLTSGISLETKRFNYNLGINLFYYPSLQKNIGKDIEVSVTYKFK